MAAHHISSHGVHVFLCIPVITALLLFFLVLPVAADMPETNFTAIPLSGTANLTVQFTNTSTNHPLTFNWTFGDGSLVNSTDQDPVHTFTSPGTYTVSLTVSNTTGNYTATKPGYILVVAPAPVVAAFSANITTGTFPQAVRFTDLSTNSPANWLWTFGDGITSAAQNPEHTYTEPGWYTVSLKAGNYHSNATTTKTEYIYIAAGSSTYATGVSGISMEPEPSWTLQPVLNETTLGANLSVNGDMATVTQPNPFFSSALFRYDHITRIGGNINGTLSSLQMTSLPYTTTLIGVGQVGVQVVLNLQEYNPSGTFAVFVTNRTSTADETAFSTAAGSTRPLRSLSYEMDLSTSGLFVSPGSAIYFSVPKTWSDTYGSDNIRLFRNNNGVISVLPASLDSSTATTATYRAITPGFSRFAPGAIGPEPPAPDPGGGSSDSTAPAHGEKTGPKDAEKPEKVPEPPKEVVPVHEPEAPQVDPPAINPPAPAAAVPEVAAPPEQSPPPSPSGIGAAMESVAHAVQEGGARASGFVSEEKPAVPADDLMHAMAKPFAAAATGVALAGITAMAGSLVAGGSASASAGAAGTISGHILNLLQNGYKTVTDFANEQVMGKVEDKAAGALEQRQRNRSQSLEAGRNSFLPGRLEMLVLLAGAVLYGLAFVVAERLGFVPEVIGVYIVVCGAVVALHELMHHLIARKFVMTSEVRFNMTGICTTFLTAWFFGNVFSQPLTTKIPDDTQGEKKAWGMTMLAGPLMSVACAVVFALLIPAGGIWTMIGTTGLTVNMVQIVFSLIPVTPQDGKTVFAWSRPVWCLVFVPVAACYLILYLL